mgnify:CR=1 FL=1
MREAIDTCCRSIPSMSIMPKVMARVSGIDIADDREHRIARAVEVAVERQHLLPREPAQHGFAANAPAPAAMRLQQKHVVMVEVRPDPAAVAGVADHQIVQPCVGHKAKLVHQRMGGIQ